MPMKEGCLSRKLQERKKEKHLIKSKLRRGKSSSTKNRNVTNQNVRDNSEETYKCGICEFSSRHQESFQVYISEWFSMIRKSYTLLSNTKKMLKKTIIFVGTYYHTQTQNIIIKIGSWWRFEWFTFL